MRWLLAGVLVAMAWLCTVSSTYASYERYASKDHTHEEVTHTSPDVERNFYAPIELEENVTPQRFRTPWFQGIFATQGVELGGHEPVWFAGARAKFDLFPKKEAAS